MAAEQYLKSRGEEGGWDPEGYRQWLLRNFPVTFKEGYFDEDYLDVPELVNMASDQIIQAFTEKLERENQKLPPFERPNGEIVYNPAREAVRNLMIRRNDHLWQEHLLKMDHLRSDVSLRSVGQRDPLMEFKHEAFVLFDELSRNLRTDTAQDLFRFEIIPPPQQILQFAGMKLETNRSFLTELEGQSAQAPINGSKGHSEEEEQMAPLPKPQPVIVGQKVGRNDPCPCGSGKKYKKCCGIHAEDQEILPEHSN
jgi:preprotein translocase subunit SecA